MKPAARLKTIRKTASRKTITKNSLPERQVSSQATFEEAYRRAWNTVYDEHRQAASSNGSKTELKQKQ